jgi:hypothetical protein
MPKVDDSGIKEVKIPPPKKKFANNLSDLETDIERTHTIRHATDTSTPPKV